MYTKNIHLVLVNVVIPQKHQAKLKQLVQMGAFLKMLVIDFPKLTP